MLSNHNQNCQQCDKNGEYELLHVAGITGAQEGRYQGSKAPTFYDALTSAIHSQLLKCILCGHCVARCRNAHGMGVFGFENRGFQAIIALLKNVPFSIFPVSSMVSASTSAP